MLRSSKSARGRRALAAAVGPVYEPLESRLLMSVNVTTYHYDNARDGANTAETALTLADVKTSSFGKIASLPVDAQVYAQPLVMTGVPVAGQGTHDVVLVATENDTVYAFDAEGNNPAQGYLWKTSLLQTGETAVPQSDYQTTDIIPLIGVTGTPVIDPTTGTLYVVGSMKESNATYQQRLYAIDITSGAFKFGGGVMITGSVPGTGYANVNGVETFSPYWENQRPALTLANGQVYIAWSAHGDENPWHGWVMAYSASTLQQDYVYCDTANGDAGGIWMSGGGIAVDSSGNLYFTTGNGDFDPADGSYGMAIEKLSPSLAVEDYFAPYNQASLSDNDLDYGCSSVIILPPQNDASAPNEILTESKWGTMFLNNGDTGAMGEFNANGTGPNDDLGEVSVGGDMHNTISYWNGNAYVGGDGLQLKSYTVGGGALGQTYSSETAHTFGTAGASDGQGAGITISSNGSSNGIAWALDNSGFNTNPAVLYAYNASNLGQLLYSSSQAANNRDAAAGAVKFQTAVVANGYVYVAGNGAVSVYGLINPSTATPTLVTPASASPSPVTGTTTNLSALGSDPAADFKPVYTWAATTVPAGANTPTFSANGTNSSNAPTATFYQAGAYTFTVTITDPNSGLSTTSSVNVAVNQTLTGITVTPSTVMIDDAGTQQFSAQNIDQFSKPMATQPTFAWAVAPGGTGGTVTSTGLYTAPSTGTGTDTVTATSGGVTASAVVTVELPSATIQVNLSASDNNVGIVSDGNTFNGGLDGGGAALSGNLLGTSLAWNGSTFSIPAATAANNIDNVVYGAGQTITLSQNKYSGVKLLATRINGNVTGLTFTVTYTDGTTQTLTQSFSDWYTPQNYAGESIAVTMPYRDQSDGTRDARTFYLYGYSFGLNSAKAIKSITLPNDNNLNIVALDLVGVAGTAPVVTTAAAANPSTVTGTTTTLSVLGTDSAGDASPAYTWAAINAPSGAATPTFSVNGTAASNVSTATFYQAGAYTFQVTITDPTDGLSAISNVNVTVSQTMSGLTVTPAGPVALTDGQTQQFAATAVDQFGQALAAPPAFTWSLVSPSVGTISTTGLYTAPATGSGSATIQAVSGAFTGQSTVQVTNVANAYFYPALAGWYRAGAWQGTSGTDGGGNYTSPAGNTVLISKNPSVGTLRDAYLKFNISNAAFAGDTINSVTLTFDAAALNQAGPVAFGVYSMSNTSWGATTADPSPAPTYTGSTLIGSTQNVGGTQGSYGSYTFSLGNAVTNATNGLISLELNSPAATLQETGIEIDNALNTPGADPVLTVNYTVTQPAWLGTGSQATFNPTTNILTVTGPTSIVADPGSDQPIIEANGSSAVVTVSTGTALQVHIGGLSLTNGASAVVTSLGAARTATNHRVLVLGLPGASAAPMLTIDASSKLDLADNDLGDHDGDLAAVTAMLKTGFNEGPGYWNGNGIASSTAAASKLTALGVAKPAAAGTVDLEPVSTADVEIKYTWYGDANLDGKVDGSDYSLIDAGYASKGALSGWSNGDFNYDGVIDGSDYTLVDNAFNNQATPLATATAQVTGAAAAPAVPMGTGAVASPAKAVAAFARATLPISDRVNAPLRGLPSDQRVDLITTAPSKTKIAAKVFAGSKDSSLPTILKRAASTKRAGAKSPTADPELLIRASPLFFG